MRTSAPTSMEPSDVAAADIKRDVVSRGASEGKKIMSVNGRELVQWDANAWDFRLASIGRNGRFSMTLSSGGLRKGTFGTSLVISRSRLSGREIRRDECQEYIRDIGRYRVGFHSHGLSTDAGRDAGRSVVDI